MNIDTALSREWCQALFAQIVGMAQGGGETAVGIEVRAECETTWARNRTHVVASRLRHDVYITRVINGVRSHVSTSRVDAEGLRRAVRVAEEVRLMESEKPEVWDREPTAPPLHPTLWSEATYNSGTLGGIALAEAMIAPTEAAGLISAGSVGTRGEAYAMFSTGGVAQYFATTHVECSMTVRDKEGTASGWAGQTHYDLQAIDPAALAARALDKAQRSAHPVAIEPGRYTAILEPQAVADLFEKVIGDWYVMERPEAERGLGPFAGREPGRSKITERVLDERLTVRADPMDPDGGFVPFDLEDGAAYRPVNWIEAGILRQLGYSRQYALRRLGLDQPLPHGSDFRLTAGPGVPTVSVEAMIAKTERGVLVTRFSGVVEIDRQSKLLSGYTRDGLWLIEHGQITKPIKNFRFTESPLFALNNLEDVGTPVRVFNQRAAIVAPPVRVRDFSFTGLADSV